MSFSIFSRSQKRRARTVFLFLADERVYRKPKKSDIQPGMTDHRRYSASAARNRDPILDVLRGELPSSGLVLEVASGTGEHVVHFAQRNPDIIFQPSDPSTEALQSIASWTEATGLKNIRPPIRLDVLEQDWPVQSVDAVFCCNMIHIAPWEACRGLIAGAGRIMGSPSPLIFYGPFLRAGVETAPGNRAFDLDLRQRNPDWGIRHLDAVSKLAAEAGFSEPVVTEMPANNLCVCLRRQSAHG